jgi:hypothetical protein
LADHDSGFPTKFDTRDCAGFRICDYGVDATVDFKPREGLATIPKRTDFVATGPQQTGNTVVSLGTWSDKENAQPSLSPDPKPLT